MATIVQAMTLVWLGPWQAALTERVGMQGRFWPVALRIYLDPFQFAVSFESDLNFQNSYPFEYSSKIHETTSVMFLNS
jgi:hypothetical protein